VGETARRASLRDYLSLIRFSHSVFALPFALITLFVATEGRPSLGLFVLVVLAMVFARSTAMAYNRYADREIDARNPRTAAREIPRGTIHPRAALAFALANAAGFVLVSWWLGPACFWLSWPVLGVLLGYSHAKRFTSLSHVWLGLALGLAPVAADVAARGAFGPGAVVAAVLGLGVTFWVAGFDVLYACQDDAFDRREGLYSLPVRIGRRRGLQVARAFHVVAVGLFAAFGWLSGLGWIYGVGVAISAALLFWEHRLIAPDALDRIQLAFFTMNGLVGIVLCACALTDLYVG
jgi:4-hydroxybenzoate polyprenyltransferase